MLDEKSTIEYIRRAKEGDMQAKQALVDGNVSLMKYIVKRYKRACDGTGRREGLKLPW